MSNLTDLQALLAIYKSRSQDVEYRKKVLDLIVAILVELGAT